MPLEPSTAYQNVIDDITAGDMWTFVRHPGIITNDDAVIELWQMERVSGNSDNSNSGNGSSGAGKYKSRDFLLGHDMLNNGVSWVSNGADSIPFKIADAGYEVWLLHDRSTNVSSLHHLNLGYNDPLFWDFSFEEIGENEVKAAIDYIKDHN